MRVENQALLRVSIEIHYNRVVPWEWERLRQKEAHKKPITTFNEVVTTPVQSGLNDKPRPHAVPLIYRNLDRFKWQQTLVIAPPTGSVSDRRNESYGVGPISGNGR
ncbi:unnamed protein product [Dovyalis caffra]|uniref:Uncharacterized protein n=1 Tax=Dovyalis caffra TaxID=77055 RepID=A0AAV1QZP3_9ROSI|nr:unnamed protein product [Dovyalis caffra]